MVTASEEPRARAKRDQILTGARRVFLRDGFAGASTDAIAAEAKVSKRTLYVYYPSKEDLFVDVLRKLTIENPQTRALESMERMSPENREELSRDLLDLARKIVATMMQPDYLALLRTTIADIHRFPQLAGLFRASVPERAMSGLPDRFRELLVRRELEGLSYRDLADVMGIPIGTVMSRLSRARGALRGALDGMELGA